MVGTGGGSLPSWATTGVQPDSSAKRTPAEISIKAIELFHVLILFIVVSLENP
jgi:hypothetical protein